MFNDSADDFVSGTDFLKVFRELFGFVVANEGGVFFAKFATFHLRSDIENLERAFGPTGEIVGEVRLTHMIKAGEASGVRMRLR